MPSRAFAASKPGGAEDEGLALVLWEFVLMPSRAFAASKQKIKIRLEIPFASF